MSSELVDRLVEAAGRRTGPRIAIAEAIEAAGSHFSADDIADRVRRSNPGVNVSTVYRTLEVLEEAGVIDHVHLGHGRAVWHLASDVHPHLYCESCGSVVELSGSALADLSRTLDTDFGFELDSTHFALVGTCRDCRSGG